MDFSVRYWNEEIKYFDSKFIGHATYKDLLMKCNEGMVDLYLFVYLFTD